MCEHRNFGSEVIIDRPQGLGERFYATIRVVCVDCQQAFRFSGVTNTVDEKVPRISSAEMQLTVPIRPPESIVVSEYFARPTPGTA